MKKTRSFSSFLIAAVFAATLSQAQSIITTDLFPIGRSVFPIEGPVFQARPPGVTRLLLAMDVFNGTIGPEYPSRVRVPPLERIYLSAPAGWSTPIQWTKNGEPIPGATQSTLMISLATFADSGLYSLVQNAPTLFIATAVRLDVSAEGQFGNFSARIKLSPGNDIQVVGYVVNGRAPKRLLIRAVGPSLSRFGIQNPVSQPRFRIYQSDGSEYVVVRPAVVLPPVYWNAIFAQAGAFPLDGGEAPFAAYDALDLPAGSYTLHVSDDARLGGEMLVEVYEFETFPPITG